MLASTARLQCCWESLSALQVDAIQQPTQQPTPSTALETLAQVDATFCELNPCGRGTNLQLLFTLLNTKPAAAKPAGSEDG